MPQRPRAFKSSIEATARGPVAVLTALPGVALDAVVAAIEAVMREQPAWRLWDLRGTNFGDMSADALRDLVSRLVEVSPHPQTECRAAFLVSRDVDFGMMRMLMSHAEAEGYGVRLNVFRDPTEALRWLVGA